LAEPDADVSGGVGGDVKSDDDEEG